MVRDAEKHARGVFSEELKREVVRKKKLLGGKRGDAGGG